MILISQIDDTFEKIKEVVEAYEELEVAYELAIKFIEEIAQKSKGHFSVYDDAHMQLEADKGYQHAINIIKARKFLQEIS